MIFQNEVSVSRAVFMLVKPTLDLVAFISATKRHFFAIGGEYISLAALKIFSLMSKFLD